MRKVYRLTLEQVEEIILEHFDHFEDGDEVKLTTQMLKSECECGDKDFRFILDVKKLND